MKIKELGIWVGIIAVLIGGLWLLISAVNNSPSPSAPLQIKIPEVSKNDFVRGNPMARVTLIEYADFQCPACKTYSSLISRLLSDFSKDLRIVYRLFPLTNIHQNAISSSQAAFAANKQNKFWEMSDLLYSNQESWADSSKAQDIFTGYAKQLNLNIDQFTNDFNSETARKFINDQENSSLSIGINSTPTFFVNGKIIENLPDYTAFKQIIQDALTNK